MPIVLVGDEKILEIVNKLCLKLAHTYRSKILNMIERLCQNCGITEPDQLIDQM